MDKFKSKIRWKSSQSPRVLKRLRTLESFGRRVYRECLYGGSSSMPIFIKIFMHEQLPQPRNLRTFDRQLVRLKSRMDNDAVLEPPNYLAIRFPNSCHQIN